MTHVYPNTSTPVGNETGRRTNSSDVIIVSVDDGEPEIEAERSLVEVYAVFCLLAVLALTGACGNIVVLRVFSRPHKRDRSCSPGASATVYVLSLAAADLVTCVVVMPSTIYMEHVQFRIGVDFVCKFYEFLKASNVPFSALIMVAIAVDRYICICHPLRHATLATGRRARFVVVFLTLVAATLGVCTALRFGVYHRIDLPRKHPSTTVFEQHQRCRSSGTTDNDATQSQLTTTGVNEIYVSQISPTSMIGQLWNCSLMRHDGSLSQQYGDTPTTDPVVGVTGESDDHSEDFPILNTGYCGATDLIVGEAYEENFLKIHSTMYPLCLLAIIVLYGLIYRSVLVRRARRQRLRSPALPRQPSDNGNQCNRKRWTIATLLSPPASSVQEKQRCCRAKSAPEVVESSAVIDGTVNITTTARLTPHLSGTTTRTTPHLSGTTISTKLTPHLSGTTTRTTPHLSGTTTTARPTPHLSGTSPDSTDDIELMPPEASVDVVTEKISNRHHKNASTIELIHNHPRVVTESLKSAHGSGCSGQNRTLLMANLRTAAMLLVVTIVFVVSYTPAFLMSLGVIPYQMMSFYLYFVNGVANPVVYSFMNRYFRKELVAVVCRPVYGYHSSNDV